MSNKVRVFNLGAKNSSPFQSGRLRRELGIVKVRDPADAQVIMSSWQARFTAETVVPGKVHVLWTNEPGEFQFATVVKPFFPELLGDAPLYVFNAHNGQVYTDNFYYCGDATPLPKLRSKAELNTGYADKTVSFAASYRADPPPPGLGKILLNERRQRIAIEMHAAGRMRVIGRMWPDGIAEADSRSDDRKGAKAAFLRQTNFNLCYENTIADFYVTEKLWEAIAAGCLPIYHANRTIYQIFPRDSFIDGAAFKTTDALMAFIDAMPFDEYMRRINICRVVHNRALTQKLGKRSRERTRNRLISFLRAITA